MCGEGRDHEISNPDEDDQHPKDQEDLTRKSLEKIWKLWWKRWRPLTMDIFGRCVNMYAGCWQQWCHDRKPPQKVWFDLLLCLDFLNNVWMSSCRATRKRVVSTRTTSIHVLDGNSWKKQDEEGSIYVPRRPLSMKKGMKWQNKKESDQWIIPYKEEAWLNSMTSRKESD